MAAESDEETEIIIIDEEPARASGAWEFRLHCLLGRGRFGEVLLASKEQPQKMAKRPRSTSRRAVSSCVAAAPSFSSSSSRLGGELVALKILHKKMLRNAKMRERAKNPQRPLPTSCSPLCHASLSKK